MKSKKLVSLFLAAAMSVSALGFSAVAKQPVGTSAVAGSVNYTASGVELPDLQAKVTYSKEDAEKMWDADVFRWAFTDVYDWEGKYYGTATPSNVTSATDSSGNPRTYVYLQKSNVTGWYIADKSDHSNKKVSIADYYKTEKSYDQYIDYKQTAETSFWYVKDDSSWKNSFTSNAVYTFYGWRQIHEAPSSSKWATTYTNNSQRCDDEAQRLKGSDSWNVHLTKQGDNYVAVFQTIVKVAKTDDEITANLDAIDAATAKKKAEDDAKTEKSNNQGNKRGRWNGYKNAIKDDGTIPDYKDAKVVRYDGPGTCVYSASDVASIRKTANIDSDELAFVYDVNMPTGYTLLPGKRALVTLELPSGYSTNGYDVYVLHLTKSGVKKLSRVSVRTNYVLCADNSFSPFILLMVPKGTTRRVVATGGIDYTNPPTGDASAVPVALLAAASLSATGAVLLRRKRELGE